MEVESRSRSRLCGLPRLGGIEIELHSSTPAASADISSSTMYRYRSIAVSVRHSDRSILDLNTYLYYDFLIH